LIERLREDPPDLIAVSGDFVENRADHRAALPTLERLMKALSARLGIFGVLGNHDGDLLRPRLVEMGVHVICDGMVRLVTPEAAIELVGIPGVSRKDLSRFNPPAPESPEPTVRIAISHFPDSVNAIEDLKPDLVLCGHTHGGQVCLPGGFPIVTHDSLPRRMCRGVHAIRGGLLVVNRGFGFASVPLRLFCPPEVIELRFVPSD
jgi:predicted MPP superfamily phosphohydrolase